MNVRRVLATIPFTLFGIATILFFGGVATLPASHVQGILLGVARVLIIPVYSVALGISVFMPRGIGPHLLGVPAEVGVGVVVLLGLLPYVAADLALRRYRQSQHSDA